MLKQYSIPFFKPSIGEAEIESVVETLRSGWLTTGPKVKQFEADFRDRVGSKHALAVGSCTHALTLALEALGISAGDEVIVPSMTFASTGEIVMHLGATPVLADVLPGTLNIDPASVSQKVTDRTKAIIPVHYGGQAADLDAIQAIAKEHDLAVVEDAAHAIPATHNERLIGSISDVTCFSFYANKTITTGEGGMITTDRDDLAERMRIMTLHGISKDAWKRFSAEGSWYYEITAPGYKFNMTDIAGAIGVHQLAKCDDLWMKRQQIANYYRAAFEHVDAIETMDVDPSCQHAWHLFVIKIVPELLTIDRNAFINRLNELGVGTSVHYTPLHMHPLYRERFGYTPDDLPVAKSVYERIISLPIYAEMTEEHIEYVADTVNSIVEESRCPSPAKPLSK